MNARHLKRPSETDWAAVDALTDESIDTSEIAPLPVGFFEQATFRGPSPPVPVTVAVAPDVLAWYQAQGEDCERQMAAALRIYADAHRDLSAALR